MNRYKQVSRKNVNYQGHSFSADEGTIQLRFHAVHKESWCNMVDLSEAKGKENQHIVLCRRSEKPSFL